MRFMMLMIPKDYATAPADMLPPTEAIATMTKYNEELQNAGVLLALDGLTPAAKGARVTFSGGKASVHDGPFAEAKEVLGGFWIIDVRSKDEAVAWARRCPASDGDVIEVRQVQEFEDFPPEVQAMFAEAGFPSGR